MGRREEEFIAVERIMPGSSANWWAALWRGLVVDPEAKHLRRLDGAVWLLLYCILHADRTNGTLYTRPPTIARHMGIPRRTIHRWLRLLQQNGYVALTKEDKGAAIGVLRWKSAKSRATAGAMPRHR